MAPLLYSIGLVSVNNVLSSSVDNRFFFFLLFKCDICSHFFSRIIWIKMNNGNSSIFHIHFLLELLNLKVFRVVPLLLIKTEGNTIYYWLQYFSLQCIFLMLGLPVNSSFILSWKFALICCASQCILKQVNIKFFFKYLKSDF